ncbi:MAG: hypothetical protein K5686_04865, partial [Lachnospiraceae bacterium]|nr:hypothetical protein [Lachnospiraceae bacterium]
MHNKRVRRLIAMIMTVITVGAQSPITAMAGEMTEDIVAEASADEEETSVESADTVETEVSSNAAEETDEISEDTAVDVSTPEEETVEAGEDETEYSSEGFALTEADYAAKQAIRDHGLLENFAKLTEGVDYSSNEMIFLADS